MVSGLSITTNRKSSCHKGSLLCSETSSSVYEQCNNSHTPLLIRDLNINRQDDDARIEVEGNSSLGSQNCETSSKSLSRHGGAPVGLDMLPNVHGKKLWRNSDFWLLCGILSIRSKFRCLSTIVVYH